jgi:hypothetical protein
VLVQLQLSKYYFVSASIRHVELNLLYVVLVRKRNRGSI